MIGLSTGLGASALEPVPDRTAALRGCLAPYDNLPRHASRLAGLRADLDAWIKQQGDTQTVFGKPLLLGDPVTLITPGNAKKKTAP